MSIAEERDYVRCTFAAPNAWGDWDKNTEPDRPLASFAEVFSFGATGYLRLLESIYEGLRSLLKGEPRPAAAGPTASAPPVSTISTAATTLREPAVEPIAS